MLSRSLQNLCRGVTLQNKSIFSLLSRPFAAEGGEGGKAEKPKKEAKGAPKTPEDKKEEPKPATAQKKAPKRKTDEEKAKDPEYQIRARMMDAFQKHYSFVLTTDMCRLDFGYMVTRPPIFLTYPEEDMKLLRTRYQILRKYKMMISYTKELLDFPKKYPNDQAFFLSSDNTYTHEKVDSSTGEKIRYSENSKFFKNVDPDLRDHHSIQHNAAMRVYLLGKSIEDNKWYWPNFTIRPRFTLTEAHENCYSRITTDAMAFHQVTLTPIFNTFRELKENEQKDLEYRRVKGVRTYFFPLIHMQGKPALDPTLYSDYAWVTRLEASKFLTREDYATFIHLLAPY